MEMFLLYLFTRLDVLVVVLALTVGISLGCAALCFPIGTDMCGEEKIAVKKWQKRFGIVAFIALPFLVLTPSQKDAAIILGGWAVLQAAKTDTAQRLASKSVQLIESTLDKYLAKETQSTKH